MNHPVLKRMRLYLVVYLTFVVILLPVLMLRPWEKNDLSNFSVVGELAEVRSGMSCARFQLLGPPSASDETLFAALRSLPHGTNRLRTALFYQNQEDVSLRFAFAKVEELPDHTLLLTRENNPVRFAPASGTPSWVVPFCGATALSVLMILLVIPVLLEPFVRRSLRHEAGQTQEEDRQPWQ